MALDALDDPEQTFFIAELSDLAIGFVRIYYDEKSFGLACEVETLVVDDAFRGRGVGETLMEHVETEAREAGARAVRVNVLHVNDGGLRFYEKHGYRPVAVRLGKDL